MRKVDSKTTEMVGSNRTFMELKLKKRLALFQDREGVLIVPLWN